MRLGARRLLALVLTSALASSAVSFAVVTAEGQDRGRPAASRRGRDRASDRPSEAREAEADTADPDAPSTSDDEVSARSSERTEGGNKVKVIEFSGFDVNGRLKSPQLLYFLNRVRAEFDRPRLPHRSFVPELDRSTKATGF